MACRAPLALAVLALAALPLTACAPPSGSDSAPAPAATPAPASAPEAVTTPAAKTFAGKFSGVLPCASCPGIDTTLDARADGGFSLSETYQDEQGGGPFVLEGRWRMEQDGRRIRLDPRDPAEPDRLYEVVSSAEIRMLDLEGKPIASGLDYRLRRDDTTK